jgi:hypothetical protein
MSWSTLHSESSRLATQAEAALRDGNLTSALELYEQAAQSEMAALDVLDPGKQRTYGVTAVSAVSLFVKAKNFNAAEYQAMTLLTTVSLPEFARTQLRDLLLSAFQAREFESNQLDFTSGEVLISVSGGEVVRGGAPLDLVLDKVNDIKSYFYRTIELMLNRPLRKRGSPETYIQDHCRPWLFQAPAGSYQFAVRVQKPDQQSLFGDDIPKVERITHRFLEIINAASMEDPAELERIVPDDEYRTAFMRMTRNLAPTGKSFAKLVVKSATDTEIEPITLWPESRSYLDKAIKNRTPRTLQRKAEMEEMQLVGILRALHLDSDWIEVTVKEGGLDRHIRIERAGDAIDDIVGPMVNRFVIVDTLRSPDGKHFFKDIQLQE